MYLALFSVAFGSILNFGQVAVLFNILDLENYVAYRAVLNTMNMAAPFLCLGFDSAAPVLKRINPGFYFFWNILAVLLGALLILITIALILPTTSKLLPLILGLASSTSFAGMLIVANHYRVEGEINKYFISVNIFDKLVRSFIILGLAVLIQDILTWSIIMSLIGFFYVGLIALRTGCRIELDTKIFFSHVRISVPYIFAALGVVAVTRMPFYAAYIMKDDLATAKIDIWLLISLFLLIPVLNKSKFEESNSASLAQDYIAAMKLSWKELQKMEILICSGIIVVAIASVITGLASKNDLLSTILPLLIGMILIASVPNYVHVLCMYNMFGLAIKMSLLIGFFSIIAYLPMFFLVSFKVPFLFVASALMYCFIGCFVAQIIKLKISDFWRWRESLLLILFSTFTITIVEIFFDRGIL